MRDHEFLLRLFGARLRALREEKGWSVADAVARLGCSVGYYYKLERGVQEPSFEMLDALARVFWLDVVDLFVFPDASPLRHGIYDLLRKSPEHMLLRTKLSLLEQQPASATVKPTNPAEQPRKVGRPRRRMVR